VLLLVDATRAEVFGDHLEAADQLSARALALAERLGDPLVVGRALLDRGLVLAEQGAPLRRVLALHDRVEPLAQQAQDWRTLHRCYENGGVMNLWSGDVDGFRVDALRAVVIDERLGTPLFAKRFQAEACLWLGAWDEGRQAASIAGGFSTDV